MTGGTIPFAQRDWVEWGKQHARELAVGAGLVGLLLAGARLYVSSERRKEAFASRELAQARLSAEAGNLPLAARDLSRLVERFDGTSAADEAMILLNQIRLLQGQTDAAVRALGDYVGRGRPDHVRASAYGLLGGGLEDQGKLREAGETYRRASEFAPLDFLKAQYLLDAGRVLATARDTAAAQAAYGEVLARFGALNQAQEARVRMAELGGHVPPPPEPDRRPPS